MFPKSWAAATTVGLLIYSMDSKIQFDPLGLDEDITPEAVRACVDKKDFSKAVTMAVFLNEQDTLQFAVEAVPKDRIALVAKAAVTGESCLKRSSFFLCVVFVCVCVCVFTLTFSPQP
jgi:hypothetical protein